MDLMEELERKTRILDASIKELAKTGRAYAEAYTNYRMALAKELVKLKDEGYAITLAGDIARGKPEIAKLKFEEIAKEAVYLANKECINAAKLQIKIIQEQINKEWSSLNELQ